MTVATEVKVTGLSPVVRIGGSRLPDDLTALMRTLRVERGVRLVGQAELTFTDDDFELLGKQSGLITVGAAITVTVTRKNKDIEVFAGEVTGVRAEFVSGEWGTPPLLTVVAHERTAELRHKQQTTVLTKVTVSDVISRLCQGYGLEVSVASGAFPQAEHPTFVVTTSPLALLEDLCDRYGAEWWLEDKTLNVGKVASVGQVTVGLKSLVSSFSLETDNAGVSQVQVFGWDPANKTAVTGSQQGAASDPAAPKATAGVVDRPMGTPDARPVHARAREMMGQDDLGKHATGISLAAARERHVVQIEVIDLLPTVAPRTAIELTEAGGFSGTYRATTVVHSWDANGGRTKVYSGSRRSSGLASALSALSPAGRTGVDTGTLLVGLVSDINPKEAATKGCIQVKFPTLGDNVVSAWARVLLPGAGKDRGLVIPHQINDEVIVGFEEGDLQRPVVLGAVHGGTAAPPTATAVREGEVKTAGLTSLKGHTLLVTDEDEGSKNGILVKHTKGSSVLLNDQGITVEGEGVPVKLKVGSGEVVVDDQGNVTLKGPKVVIEGTTEVEIKAPTVKVAATGQLDLSASGSAALKGQGSVEVSATGVTQVKGGLVKIN